MTNDLVIPPVQTRTAVTQTTAVEQSRAVAEVQAAVVVAQSVPRSITRAYAEMREACGRTTLAQKAFYRVPNRGSGPSVHLARELARIWGNFQYGVNELRRDDTEGVSEIQAFAWDVQTNTRSTRTFQVPHERMARKQRQKLVDLGDIYLNNQNVGARAVRECIFTVLPPWFTEDAQAICQRTLSGGGAEQSTADQVSAMVKAFRDLGVTEAMLEDRLGKKRGQWGPGEIAQARVIHSEVSRGEVRVEDAFETAEAPSGGVSADDIAKQAGGQS